MTDQLLTIDQVADWLQIPVATLRDWRARGAPGTPLPAIRVGGHVRYRRADVDAWLDANTADRAAPRRLRATRRRTA